MFPEDEGLGHLRSALQALSPSAPPPPVAPKIEWSDSATAAAANRAAAAAAAAEQQQQQQLPPQQQRQAARAGASGAATTTAEHAAAPAAALSEPRDRQTQASCLHDSTLVFAGRGLPWISPVRDLQHEGRLQRGTSNS